MQTDKQEFAHKHTDRPTEMSRTQKDECKNWNHDEKNKCQMPIFSGDLWFICALARQLWMTEFLARETVL